VFVRLGVQGYRGSDAGFMPSCLVLGLVLGASMGKLLVVY